MLDHVPRDVAEDGAFTLNTLARQAMAQLELRRAIAERDDVLVASRRIEQRQSLLVRTSPQGEEYFGNRPGARRGKRAVYRQLTLVHKSA